MSHDKNLIAYLREFVTEERWGRISEVLHQRTRHLTVVLEDIYQPHNASAVLRSCECFGIQDVHIIENRNEFDPNTGVTIGADQWLTLHRYRGKGGDYTRKAFDRLKSEGYRLVATTPHTEMEIGELPVAPRTALVFGAELEGLSDYAIKHADARVRIPLHGFSESYNISVSAALCLYDLTQRLRASKTDWRLSEQERNDLKLEWLKNSVRAADKLQEKFNSEQ